MLGRKATADGARKLDFDRGGWTVGQWQEQTARVRPE